MPDLPSSAAAPARLPASPDSQPPSPPPDAPISENFRQLPIPEKNPAPPPPPSAPPPLNPRQQAALALLLAGHRINDIARALNVAPRTLYNWRHHHPAFIAEFTRIQRDLWSDIAADLRMTVAAGVDTIRQHLSRPNDLTQLRAARLLINLVNSPRLAPTGPTTLQGILDEMLRQQTPPPPAPDAPTFTDAQRQALLQRLLAESADPDDPGPQPG